MLYQWHLERKREIVHGQIMSCITKRRNTGTSRRNVSLHRNRFLGFVFSVYDNNVYNTLGSRIICLALVVGLI